MNTLQNAHVNAVVHYIFLTPRIALRSQKDYMTSAILRQINRAFQNASAVGSWLLSKLDCYASTLVVCLV